MSRTLLVATLALFGWSIFAAAENQAAILQAYYDKTRTLSGTFEQKVTDSAGQPVSSSRGRFWIFRPGRFRWEWEAPFRQLIVSDGNKVWIYDPDLEQVIVRPLQVDGSAVPALLLSGSPNLTESFVVTAAPDEPDWLDLRPRTEETDFTRLRLHLPNGDLRGMILEDALGQTTAIEFFEVSSNAPIDAGRFRFDVPDGVDVLTE